MDGGFRLHCMNGYANFFQTTLDAVFKPNLLRHFTFNQEQNVIDQKQENRMYQL